MDINVVDALWRAAFAEGGREAVQRALRAEVELALVMWPHEPRGSGEATHLRGLLLAGGEGDIPFPAGSPWPVPATAGLTEALDRIWAPVADHCPNFLTALHEEVLGLALVAHGDAHELAYLYLEEGSGEPLRDLTTLPERLPRERLVALWGSAPTALGPDEPVEWLDGPLPAGVRDLARVHARLTSFDTNINLDRFTRPHAATILARHAGESLDDHFEDSDYARAVRGDFDRWLGFCVCDCAAQVHFLDLADREPDGSPRVTTSTIDGTSHRGAPFWAWADDTLPFLFFDVYR